MALVPAFWVKVPVPVTPIASPPPTKSGPPAPVAVAEGVSPKAGIGYCALLAYGMVVQLPPTIRPMAWFPSRWPICRRIRPFA